MRKFRRRSQPTWTYSNAMQKDLKHSFVSSLLFEVPRFVHPISLCLTTSFDIKSRTKEWPLILNNMSWDRLRSVFACLMQCTGLISRWIKTRGPVPWRNNTEHDRPEDEQSQCEWNMRLYISTGNHFLAKPLITICERITYPGNLAWQLLSPIFYRRPQLVFK